MLAFHNEHIASCAFLTYFSPESTTAAATAAANSTASTGTLLNDKQAITGITCPCSHVNSRRHQPYLHHQHHNQNSNQHQLPNLYSSSSVCFCLRSDMRNCYQQQQQKSQVHQQRAQKQIKETKEQQQNSQLLQLLTLPLQQLDLILK